MVTIPNITLIRSSRQLTSIYWLVLIIIILSGCGNNDNRPGDLNITPSYELDTQILEPPTLSVSSTTEFSLSTSVSPSATRLPTFTPPPILSEEEAKSRILELLSENFGCSFPCWWGITPGISSWHEVYNLQVALSSQISWVGKDDIDQFVVLDGIAAFVSVPKNINPRGSIFQSYRVDILNAIVNRITAEADISLSELLTAHGIPSEVRLILTPLNQGGYRQFFMGIIYTDQNIIAIYYSELFEPSRQGYYEGCFDGIFSNFNNPTLTLWSSPIQLTLSDIDPFDLTTNVPSLEDSIGMDLDSFYQTYKDPDKRPCFETPEAVWENQ